MPWYVMPWNACFGTVKHDWTSIDCYWANRKHFLPARGNIWNSEAAFYNKISCLLRQGCFKYELLLLFSIIPTCFYRAPLGECFCIIEDKTREYEAIFWQSYLNYDSTENDLDTSRGVFRNLSTIQDGAFAKILKRRKPLTIFTKNVHLGCLAGFWIRLKKPSECSNLGQNICRLFHVLAQFPFMISEAELDYYHQKVNVRVAESVKT